MTEDIYRTIEAPAEGLYKDKGSRFLAFAYPLICNDIPIEEQVKSLVDPLKTRFYDARHHCYVWRTGGTGLGPVERTRLNDDGEPSGTAARPMMGELLSNNLTNMLLVVVRYFGGIKLGVPGLIAAYKGATSDALANANIVECTVNQRIEIEFPYIEMNSVMKLVKEFSPRILAQQFDNHCYMNLEIRMSQMPTLEARFVDLKCLLAKPIIT